MAPLFKTRITDLFGIDHPLICGGLMWLSDANYVAASVNAGGMGFITAKTFPDPGAFRAELQKCRELTGGKRFGVNLYLSMQPGSNDMLKGHVDIMLSEGVDIVETAGMPPQEFLGDLKSAGVIINHKVASIKHAKKAETLGVDAITIVGAECGGHPGLDLVGTMVQTAAAAQSLTLPYIVGGGIGHGSQLVAALAMGADAVVMGSRMTVSEEIWAHRAYKDKVVEASERDTRLIMSSFRNTYRAFDNEDARSVSKLEASGVTDYEEYRPFVAGIHQKEAYTTGDWNRGVLSLGQSAVFANEVKPVAEIFADILSEAKAAAERMDMMRFPSAAAGRVA